MPDIQHAQAPDGARAPVNDLLQIGDWVVDATLDELRQGEIVRKIEPRKMRLLMALAQRPNALVTLEQLLDEVWTDLAVTPSSVYQTVSQLRGVLGDSASQPRYIATVPRKGYRLVAPVQALHRSTPAVLPPALPAPPAMSRRPWLLLAGVLALAGLGTAELVRRQRPGTGDPGGAGRIMLAVLPFEDLSANGLEQPVAEGLADNVIGEISRHQDVQVTARMTSFQFRKPENLASEAQQLAVTHVLSGALARSHDGLRLQLRLHRAADSTLLWQAALEQPATALSGLALQAANAALAALGATPLPGRAVSLPAADTYELYLQGLQHQRSGQIEGILKARAYFQRTIDRDPGFAPGYVGQAATWISEYHYGRGLGFRDMDARAQPLLDRALKLDPGLPIALGLQGHLKASLSQHDEARRWLTQALAKAPGDASLLVWMGSNESDDGFPAQAARHFTKAAQLSPLSVQIEHRAGLAAIHAGQYAQAEARYRRAVALAPGHANSHWGFGILGYARGRLADAVQGYRKALAIDAQREQLWTELAWICLDLGLRSDAAQAFAHAGVHSATPPQAHLAATRQFLQADDLAGLAQALQALQAQRAAPGVDARAPAGADIDTALLLAVLGQKEAALQALRGAVGLLLADPVPLYNNWLSFHGHHVLLDVAAVYTAAGLAEQAAPFVDQASSYIERYAQRGNRWHAAGYHRARVEALRGRPAAALAMLQEAVRLGWRRGWWLRHDPALAGVRQLPGFAALLVQIEQDLQTQRRSLQPA